MIIREIPMLLLSFPQHLSSHPIFFRIWFVPSLVFCVIFCRSLFVLLSFFFWPLYCQSFFDWQLLITLLVSFYTPAPTEGGVYCFTSVRPSICPSVQDIFRRIFLSNYWWQKSDIWSQALYRYAILWEAYLDLSDSYFLFADLVGFYTHWTYMRGYHKWALAHSSSCLAFESHIYVSLGISPWLLFIHFSTHSKQYTFWL